MEQFYYAKDESGLSREEIRAALQASLEGRTVKKALIIPPDFTRFHSQAGLITNIYYHLLTDAGCQVDVMPALGTHEPVSKEQWPVMFGDVPYENMIVHDWRHDVVKIGEVPASYLEEITEGLWHDPVSVEVNRRIMDESYDLIISPGQVVPHEVIEQIVADAAYAPSWKNTQIARYVLVEDRTTIDKMAEEMVLDFKLNEKTLKNCPAVMVLTYVTGRSGYERDGSFSTPKEAGFEMFDAGIAAQTFCLAAWERGVGTVITGYFDEEKITRLLNLPENQKVGCVIGLGYPDEEPAAPKRKSVEDLLTYK